MAQQSNHDGLSRAGLHLSCRRQRRPRNGDRDGLRIPSAHSRRRGRARRGLLTALGDLLPIVLKTPQSGRTFALNPYSGRRAESFQCRSRRDRCQYRHADCSRDQGADSGEFGSAACFVVFAFRSDRGMAGHYRQWRQRGSRGMGRRDGGPDREHELRTRRSPASQRRESRCFFPGRRRFNST